MSAMISTFATIALSFATSSPASLR
jgi:hypothetical protein